MQHSKGAKRVWNPRVWKALQRVNFTRLLVASLSRIGWSEELKPQEEVFLKGRSPNPKGARRRGTRGGGCAGDPRLISHCLNPRLSMSGPFKTAAYRGSLLGRDMAAHSWRQKSTVGNER